MAITPIEVLTAAFRDDPLAHWLFPDDEMRSRAMPFVFGDAVERSAATGELMVDGPGVAVWLRLAAGEPPFGEPDPREPRLAAFTELLRARHPHDREHLYLPFLGVAEPGRGIGSALLTSRLSRADAEGLPAYLEASSPRSVPLYRRHGFEFLGEPVTLPDGPRLWPMWREPRGENP